MGTDMDTPPDEIEIDDLHDEANIPVELRGAPPRPIPDVVRKSKIAQIHRSFVWGFAMAGGICISAGPLPFVQTLALYILPLGYQFWLGIPLLAISLFSFKE